MEANKQNFLSGSKGFLPILNAAFCEIEKHRMVVGSVLINRKFLQNLKDAFVAEGFDPNQYITDNVKTDNKRIEVNQALRGVLGQLWSTDLLDTTDENSVVCISSDGMHRVEIELV